MSGLDVAGVIGTWFAAVVAIIALVGIVAPVLIWRASRTERHKAIAAIGTDSNGFVSKGLPLWSGIRMFQRVRAPKLKDRRRYNRSTYHFDEAKRSCAPLILRPRGFNLDARGL